MRNFLFITALLCTVAAAGGELVSQSAVYRFDGKNGEITQIIRRRDGAAVVRAVKNSYLVKNRLKDFQAEGGDDKVTGTESPKGELVYTCTNPALPGMTFKKRYFLVNDTLYREITYTNNSKEKLYILPFTSVHFEPGFFDSGYYFGAGYLGPYRPAEKVSSPVKVEKYKQSSKGMVLVNPDTKLGSIANIRLKVNDQVVLPWWQSTIGRYREMDDRLWYLPDGWKMCSGTLDMEKDGGSIRYTDMLVFFHGDLITLFDDILAQNPDFKKAMASIPPAPDDFLMDMLCMPQWGHEPYLKYLTQLTGEGNIIFRSLLSCDWGDYRWRDGFNGRNFGRITGEEARDYVRNIHSISPRIAMGTYSIVVAADKFSPIYKERPEWFRTLNRADNEDIHFPGMISNYQTMLNKPEVRTFMADTLVDKSVFTESPYVYVDEAQQQNTINYQQNELIRDDHNMDFYRELRQKALKKGKFLFFNGSGNPFADLNFMESNPTQLRNDNWRDFAGVALGMELFSKMRPESRIALLYWKNDFDYLTRCISNGWVIVPDTHGSIPHIKAGYDIGKTLPIRASYTPDFYKNPATDVESYAVQRYRKGEVILSFINHSRQKSALPVTADMSTLPFDKKETIQVFAVELDCSGALPANKFLLSDAEHRENFRRYNWHNRAITVPKLIYSGKPEGVLKHTFHNTNGRNLAQLIFVPGNMSVFSVNGVERNYYFANTAKVKISGNTVTSEADTAQIMLADTKHDFTRIKVNGKSVPAVTWDIGGKTVQLVNVSKGISKIEFVKVDKKASGLNVLTLNGKTVACGVFLEKNLPQKYFNGKYILRPAGSDAPGKAITLSGGRGSDVRYENYPATPAEIKTGKADVSFDGARITGTATFESRHRKLRNLQPDLPCSVMIADASKRTLTAGTSRKEDSQDTDQYAGFELENARTLELKLTHNFHRAYSVGGDRTHTYSSVPVKDFAGFVVDYQDADGIYAKRVCFSIGIGAPQLKNSNPAYGKGEKQDVHVALGEFLNTPESRFSLDLAKYAPAKWNGKVFFSVGCNHILANRTLTVEILSANNTRASNFIEGFEYGNLRKVKKEIHAPLFMPKSKAAVLETLLPYPGDDALRHNTKGYFSYDSQNLYVTAVAAETGRTPSVKSATAYNNDRVELYLKCGDGKILQIIGDAKGGKFTLPVKAGKEITVKSKVIPGKEFQVSFTIPWQVLKYSNIAPGLSIPFNLARVRLEPGMERSSSAPCRRDFGFRDVEKYGKICVGREVPGMGRFEEF